MASRALPVRCSAIYCHGLLLDTVQRSGIYQDSKTFVDMTMLSEPDTIEAAFHKLYGSENGSVSQEALSNFLTKYFTGPGDELEMWTPPDWVDIPALYHRLEDPGWQQFVLGLNRLWKNLGRKIKSDVKLHPQRCSLLLVPNPFVIPGDRFREFYYWDSYWMLNGLLLSDMRDTARGMIENFLAIVERFGFVPNGGRIYYTNRSQPPLLTAMVNSYYEHTKDERFLQMHIHTLEKEYTFWKEHRSVNVTHATTGKVHELCRYNVELSTPRPEGYAEDVKLTEAMAEENKADVYSNLASACESGWDFSSRWLNSDDPKSLGGIKTSRIIPVDLNVYLCWTEELLAKFFEVLDDKNKHRHYNSAAAARRQAVQEMLWNGTQGAWFDLDLDTSQHRVSFYPSNVFPLLVLPKDADGRRDIEQRVYEYLESLNLTQYEAGLPTSLVDSGQQWDMPNAWPPLVHLFIESLSSCAGHQALQDLAKTLAMRWLNSNARGFDNHKQMFEKYNVHRAGEAGGGGEYVVQVGFGWTNGVVLMLLDKYARVLEPKDTPVGKQENVMSLAAVTRAAN